MGQNICSSQVIVPQHCRGAKLQSDPLYGFPEGREVREPPKATREEMKSAGLAHWQMDYCADELIDWIKCNRAVPYWPFACRDQKKAHQDCEMNDYHIRILNAEREKRLKMRERRKAGLPELENPALHHFWHYAVPYVKIRPRPHKDTKNAFPYPDPAATAAHAH